MNRDHRIIANMVRRGPVSPDSLDWLSKDGFEADQPWYGGWGAIWNPAKSRGVSACAIIDPRRFGMVWCFNTRFFIVGTPGQEIMEHDHPFLRRYSVHDPGLEDFVMDIGHYLAWPKPHHAIA